MGELIRNLHDIKIGKSSLMIELNEGYSSKQRFLIHIQNKVFRYQLTDKDFFHLSATILRAKSEMDYFKSSLGGGIYNNKLSTEQDNLHTDKKVLYEFCDMLKKLELTYRIVEVREKFATVLVEKQNLSILETAISKDKRTRNLKHPLGGFFGYRFIYKLTPFRLFKYNNYYIEVFCELPSMSLTPKTWLPLDRAIQSRVWEMQCINSDGYCVLDSVSLYIYRLMWSVFRKGGFSKSDIMFLEEKREVLSENCFRYLLSKEFFYFTDKMISLLQLGEYDKIIPSYFAFKEY